MTSNFEIKFSGSTNPFDSWYEEEHGTGLFDIESDVDEVDFDEMNDKDDL